MSFGDKLDAAREDVKRAGEELAVALKAQADFRAFEAWALAELKDVGREVAQVALRALVDSVLASFKR